MIPNLDLRRHGTRNPADVTGEISPRQAEILALVAEALSNKQIAHQLGISEATVKAHISKTIQVTGCRNRVGLAILWLQRSGRLRA